ncbi:LbetaH domain-containing protein [Nonlabens marinus]|uniref:hypothetical protein n=1 Tax=Nonlabens marinus TaxID=930802 RepID=UPI00373FD922
MIGNDFWIGANTVILSGVIIVDRVVVEAMSLVGHHVPPSAIVSGNSVKVIGYRFDKEIKNKIK